MAGAILVSRGNGISMGGPAFRYMIEAIRAQMLASQGARYIPSIYFGHDESASDFISIVEQEANGFNWFYDAVLAASVASAGEGPEFFDLWNELLDLLRADPRWDGPLPIDT